MRSIWGLIIFLAIFLAISYLVNGYVLFRLTGYFHLKRTGLFYVLLGLLGFSLVGSSMLHRVWPNSFTEALFKASADWIGWLWLLFCALVVFDLVRLAVRLGAGKQLPDRAMGLILVLAVTVVAGFAIHTARHLRVRPLRFAGADSLRFAQITDVHLSSIEPGYFQKILEKVNSLNPDAVFVTGDLIDDPDRKTAAAVARLDEIKAPVFFIAGNHEGYAGLANVARILEGTRVRWLRNEAVLFKGVQIIGLDDSMHADHVERQLAGMELAADKYKILLCHQPLGFPAAARAGIDLMLSGHTHAGQIWPFTYLVKLKYPRVKGIYREGGSSLYVSSGTGTWGPRMRLGSQSEVVQIDLQ